MNVVLLIFRTFLFILVVAVFILIIAVFIVVVIVFVIAFCIVFKMVITASAIFYIETLLIAVLSIL